MKNLFFDTDLISEVNLFKPRKYGFMTPLYVYHFRKVIILNQVYCDKRNIINRLVV